MMADSVEAASRSLKEHTREAITDLVNKIIDGHIVKRIWDIAVAALKGDTFSYFIATFPITSFS